jgi:hypothetical protein
VEETCFWPEQGGGRESLPVQLGVGRGKAGKEDAATAGSALLVFYWAGCCVFSGSGLGGSTTKVTWAGSGWRDWAAGWPTGALVSRRRREWQKWSGD